MQVKMSASVGLFLFSIIRAMKGKELPKGVTHKQLESLENSLGNALVKTRKVRNMLKKQQKNGGNNGTKK